MIALSIGLTACGQGEADGGPKPRAPVTVRPAAVMADERESFIERCSTTCVGSGFQKGRVKEREVVSETVRRECFCVTGDKEKEMPDLFEEVRR